MWHAASVLALPFVSLLAGLASLYIDPQREPGKKWILVALLLLSSIGTFTGGLADDREKESNKETMLNQSQSINRLTKLTEGVSTKQDTISTSINTVLARLGLNSATASVLRRSISADSARAAILPAVASSDSRNITVTYYPKNVDGPVVVNALKEGGFQVESGTGNARNANLATNAIWVGDLVSAEQARFVALTLVRAGVGIVSIRRFRNGAGSKANRIEIGTDGTLNQAQPLTVEQINSLTEITRSTATQTDLIS